MRRAMIVILLFAGSVLAFVMNAWAGDASIQADGAVTWQAGVDGVEIEWNPDWSVKRISSKYSTPVEFGDRRGVYKAQAIAEEKAKAAIVRFLNQSVSSTRLVTEVQADVNKATQERQTNTQPTVRKVDERTLVEALTEVTTSFANGTLKGVVVLEKGYDNKSEEAWVVVGISEKSIAASKGVEQMQSGSPSAPLPAPKPSATSNDSIVRQPSETRRGSGQKDW